MKPWSSTYWPDRSGGIANRYTNKVAGGIDILNGVPFSKREFKRDFRRLEKNLLTMDEKELNKLSPAEKYDLIVNDLKFTFSKSVWKKIDHNRDHWGRTTYWTGICHGWAPASIHFPRPKSTVTVPVLNGAKYLDLYPSDIKALGSFLWANMGNYPTGDTLFAGNRCNKKKPLRDPDTGLIGPITNFTRNENECSDVDPLLFHIVLLNRLALQSKSFIIDVDYNEPVNNHPVTGFELKYFNPKTGKYSDYKSAKIQLSKIERDALKDHRARNTNQVLGIEAKVYTAHWRQPIRNRTDSVENDKDLVMVYKYELDLDSKDNPLKGHWRAARRNGVKGKVRFPDFIWDFKSDFTPREYFSSISNELHLDHHLLQIRLHTGKNILETINHNSIKMIKLFIET